jgi:hypothetical protein
MPIPQQWLDLLSQAHHHIRWQGSRRRCLLTFELNPQQNELQVESANMFAVQGRLTKTSMKRFVQIVQSHCTFFALMPFRGMIVFEMPCQLLSSSELTIARNTPCRQEMLDFGQLQ